MFVDLNITVYVCVELGAVWERHKCFNGEAEGLQDEAFHAAAR